MLKKTKSILSRVSPAKRYQRKLILTIALCWTVIDSIFFFWRKALGILPDKYYIPETNVFKEVVIRELNVFIISLTISYFLIVFLKTRLNKYSLVVNLAIKTIILIVAALIMTFFIYITYEWLISGHTLSYSLNKYFYNVFHRRLLIQKMPEWIILFIATLLAMEVNQKYSRGVFFNIMIGKYLQPREEKRIILFLDLRDSTPIAEKLGHKEYFKFIRDFIYYISSGLLDNDARIYQYVGDEIVVWWPESKDNAIKAVAALVSARKELHTRFNFFKRQYDTIPEYKAGIHTGMVTVGQVGIIKKDLVMSGDAINTAARIRSACTELNQKFVVSKEFADLLGAQDWQVKPLGETDLKGKKQNIELFSLNI
jgi:adenylate cyclase